jgi:ApaG protein
MSKTPGSNTLTEGIRVVAEAYYLPDESEPEQKQFVYAYRIRIKNEGTTRAKLRSRHWIILDADNKREDVRGPGVVGKHPDLGPGEEFEYRSGCPLRTRWGTMEGSYTFEREGGGTFEVAIGRFFLVPSAAHISR